MNGIHLRAANEADFETIVRINDAEVEQTSVMDRDRLGHLDGISCFHKVACIDGKVAAFLLAMQNDAPYVNDNFAWFVSRYPTFIYVDRIVVEASSGRNKLGSLLYTDLFAHARARAIPSSLRARQSGSCAKPTSSGWRAAMAWFASILPHAGHCRQRMRPTSAA